MLTNATEVSEMGDVTRAMISYEGVEGQVQAYLVRPHGTGRFPAVIVLHEIWGLNDQIKGVANRFAEQGYVACAPNLFTRSQLARVMSPDRVSTTIQFLGAIQGERLGDREYVQRELARLPAEKRAPVQETLAAIVGGIPRESLTQDLVRAVAFLRGQSFANGKVVSMGFCFGGGMSINLACHAVTDACVVFYGENPNPIELVKNITCPVLGIYAEDDMRINSHLDELVRAMVAYRKALEIKIYAGTAHQFFSETNPRDYHAIAAQDAWERVLAFYRQALAH